MPSSYIAPPAAHSVGAYCEFLAQLFEGTTVMYAELDGGGRGRRKSWAPGGAPAKTLAGRQASGPGKWRQTYPLERDGVAVARAAADVRRALRAVVGGGRASGAGPSASDVGQWLQEHGARAPTGAAAAGLAGGATIDTPADLMVTLMRAADEARAAADAASEALLRGVLEWVSPAAGHAVDDEPSRGRLVALFRSLDTGERPDGRLSAADLLAHKESRRPSMLRSVIRAVEVVVGR